MKTIKPLAFLLFFSACLKPKVERLDFFTVHMEPLAVTQIGTVDLNARVEGFSPGAAAEECGYLCSTNPDEIFGDNPTAAVCQTLPPPSTGNGFFPARSNMLEQNRTYYFRAFARQGERRAFSPEIRNYTLGDLIVLDSPARVDNDTAFIGGQRIGLAAAGGVVEQHGHVVSPTMQAPELGCPDCLVSERGPSNDDGFFESRFENLDFNTSYFVRAYVVAGGKVFYSALSDMFRVRDGWRRLPDFPLPYQDGIALSVDNQLFAGFGCNAEDDCYQSGLPEPFWRFQPGSNAWSPGPTPTNASTWRRTNTSGFAHGGKLYIRDGHYRNASNDLVTLRDLWRFDPGSGIWQEQNPPPIPRRSGAAAFSIGNFAYLGTGTRAENDTIFYDFWQYNPATDTWRPVAPLPVKADANAPELLVGRTDAIGFAIGGFGYVGGGIAGNQVGGQLVGTPLSDFWRFTPPQNDQDFGKWDFIGLLPGEARSEAVGFANGERGFFGTGLNGSKGLYSDFYTFNPASNSWKPTARFPGEKRQRAQAASLGQQGILFGGIVVRPTPNGLSVTREALKDVWMYFPE